jgi:thymidylate synthase (FAD)
MVQVLDHGFVELVDYMPSGRKCPERAIVEAARTSTGKGEVVDKLTLADKRLITRLYADQHTSPFEMIELKFNVRLPLFVARQWMRHRTASYNELSARYSVVPDMFYIPAEVRSQHKTNKQMSEGEVSEPLGDRFYKYLNTSMSAYDEYESLCEAGVARELSRIGLPQNIYTQFYYKTNLHNFLHFAKLRMASDAQYEIREYANAMYELIKPLFPVTCEAFEEYTLNAVRLSSTEAAQLRTLFESIGDSFVVPDTIRAKLL